MTMEENLERIAIALEKIADRVEAIPSTDVPEKRKPGRPAKDAAPTPAPQIGPEIDPLTGEAVTPTAPTITLDNVRDALRAYMKVNGVEKTKAIMIKHGANTKNAVVTTIPEANYPALMKELA